MPLNREQVEALLRPIKPGRVLELRGQSHVPAYDVAAHLTRVLGFGNWDKEILSFGLLFEEAATTSGGKPAWSVAYSCTLRLTIKDEHGSPVARYEDGGTGDSLQPSRAEAHDMALKSAISYALKRCAAFGLGDQFGLSLYNKGDKNALVRQTLVMPASVATTTTALDLEEGIATPRTLGNDEREDESHEDAPTPIASPAPATPAAPLPYSRGQSAVRAHPKYQAMAASAKGEFLSNTVGYRVSSLRDISDADCEQVLAALKALA